MSADRDSRGVDQSLWRWAIAGTILAAVLGTAACGGGGGGGGGGGQNDTSDLVAPTVTANSPANNATIDPGVTAVTVTFSEDMDPATITATTFTVTTGNTGVGGTVTYAGGTATFTPTAAFDWGTTFVATITTSAKDAAGNSLAANFTWTFSTTRTFQIQTPEIDIEPGQEILRCYYFRTPNNTTAAVTRLASNMTNVHHMIVFLTTNGQGEPQDKQPPGTESAVNCGFHTPTVTSDKWMYSADTPDAEMALPSDDGGGKPLALEIPANSAGFVQMHFVNPTAQTIKGQATLNVEGLTAGVAYTKTATYRTRNSVIEIPPNATNDLESQSCDTPMGAKFWRLSTHTHKLSIQTAIKDGSSVVFQSTNWERPGAATFTAPGFFSFSTNRLTYECTYNGRPIITTRSGDDVTVQEMCVAVAYFFPAPSFVFCTDGFGPFDLP